MKEIRMHCVAVLRQTTSARVSFVRARDGNGPTRKGKAEIEFEGDGSEFAPGKTYTFLVDEVSSE